MKLDRHIIRLTLLGLALVALASGATLVRSGMTQLNAARSEAETARQTLADADERLKQARIHARWVELTEQTVKNSQSLGLMPQNWIERKVNLRTFSTSRPDAERLLRETSPDNGRLFVAEDFEIFPRRARLACSTRQKEESAPPPDAHLARFLFCSRFGTRSCSLRATALCTSICHGIAPGHPRQEIMKNAAILLHFGERWQRIESDRLHLLDAAPTLDENTWIVDDFAAAPSGTLRIQGQGSACCGRHRTPDACRRPGRR